MAGSVTPGARSRASAPRRRGSKSRRATAEADLTHLASSCVESVQATLDEVAAEVEALERDGLLASPKPIDDRPEAAEIDDDSGEIAAGRPGSSRRGADAGICGAPGVT